MKLRKMTAVGVLVGFVGVAMTPLSSASASEAHLHGVMREINSATEVAVGPTSPSEQIPFDSSGTASNGTVNITAPTSARPSITLGGDGSPALGIGVPSDGEAEYVGSQAVYRGESQDDTSFVLTALQDGLRVAAHIPDEEADTSISYDLAVPAGATLESSGDGSVGVVSANGTTIAVISAPWAVDASGAKVATEYRLDGDRLTQVVHTLPSTQFPVIADPTVRGCLIGGFYPAVCVKYDRAEVEFNYEIRYITQGINSLITGVCAFGGVVGGPPCVAALTATASYLADKITEAYNSGRCLELESSYPPIPGLTYRLNVVDC